MKTKDLQPFMQTRFEQMVCAWDENRGNIPAVEWGTGSRNAGVHASALLASDNDFCYREQILSFVAKPKSVKHDPGLLRIFLEGNYIHMKWQMLFTISGIAKEIEQQGISKNGMMSYTPDAVVWLFGRYWVVEIKSMNTFGFQKLTKPPPAAVGQCSVYMMEKRIPQGIVLVEDKNNQNIKVWPFDYDKENTARPRKRLKTIGGLKRVFDEENRLPKRLKKCKDVDSPRARRCSFAEECFARRK